MAEADDKQGERFSIIDRRYKTLAEEGKPLEDSAKPKISPPSSPPQMPPSRPSPTVVERGRPAESPHTSAPPQQEHARSSDVTFDNFVRSLYTQIMIQLGMVENPLSQEVELDVEGAKQTIDILDLLKEKTKGNLSRQEEKAITEALTTSRLAFVQRTSKRR